MYRGVLSCGKVRACCRVCSSERLSVFSPVAVFSVSTSTPGSVGGFELAPTVISGSSSAPGRMGELELGSIVEREKRKEEETATYHRCGWLSSTRAKLGVLMTDRLGLKFSAGAPHKSWSLDPTREGNSV